MPGLEPLSIMSLTGIKCFVKCKHFFCYLVDGFIEKCNSNIVKQKTSDFNKFAFEIYPNLTKNVPHSVFGQFFGFTYPI